MADFIKPPWQEDDRPKPHHMRVLERINFWVDVGLTESIGTRNSNAYDAEIARIIGGIEDAIIGTQLPTPNDDHSIAVQMVEALKELRQVEILDPYWSRKSIDKCIDWITEYYNV